MKSISMKLFRLLFWSIVFLQFANAQNRQTIIQQALTDSTMVNQFDVVIKKSDNYLDNKVIKKEWVLKLKKNTLDSIQKLQSKLKNTTAEIQQLQTKIKELEASLAITNKNLTDINQEKASINFFGATIDKSLYNIIMWSIIVALMILLGLFIYKFTNSNAITTQAKNALADLEIEYEDHRRRALEREQKVMRKLQDEINKQRKKGTK